MKQNNILILTGIISTLLTIVFAFNDNVSELAPVFLLAGVGSFGWLMFRKTWTNADTAAGKAAPTTLSKISTILGITGLLCLGLSGLSLLDSSLEELAAAGLIGVLLLVIAVVLRIINGMRTNRVDTTTGVLSISTIGILVGVIAVILLGIVVIYSVLHGLTLI